mgnify:CR=1 FL=1
MAGGAVTPSGKGGRKPLDASINLVPFIDLLSCCISFLLITAVWANLSQVPVRHGKDAASSETQPPTPSLGLMLSEGRNFLMLAPWPAVFARFAANTVLNAFTTAVPGTSAWSCSPRATSIPSFCRSTASSCTTSIRTS